MKSGYEYPLKNGYLLEEKKYNNNNFIATKEGKKSYI